MSTLNTLSFIANHPLNSGQKIPALLGFLKWQIGSRLVPGPIIFEWVNGAKIVVRRGEKGVTQNVYCGLHDFEDMAYLLHVLDPEDLFIDIGANVGSYTILACAAKGSRGYSFEPVPTTYLRLLENIAINSLGSRVVALNIGLSNYAGELSFTSVESCTNHVTTESEDSDNMATVKVKVCSLDSVLGDEAPSLIKIDVEGFETPVLQGAQAALRNMALHSVIMELNGSGVRYGYNEDDILNKMKDHGFSTYQYNPFRREIKPLHGKNATHGNTLFLRNENIIREKLAKAPPIALRSRTF